MTSPNEKEIIMFKLLVVIRITFPLVKTLSAVDKIVTETLLVSAEQMTKPERKFHSFTASWRAWR